MITTPIETFAHANGNGSDKSAEAGADERSRRGVGGFVRRMWGRRAETV